MLNRMIRSALFAAYIVAACASSFADDTEIFTGEVQGATGDSVANVMFIMDTSGSMDNDFNGQTRLAAMKAGLTSVIDSLSNNVNVGLMRFTKPGGPVLFPISNLNARLPETQTDIVVTQDGVETLATTIEGDFVGKVNLAGDSIEMPNGDGGGGGGLETINTSVRNNKDDADQCLPSSSSYYGVDYRRGEGELGWNRRGNSSCQRAAGIRFRNVVADRGATVAHAYLHLTAIKDSDDAVSVRIEVEDLGNPPKYGGRFSSASRQVIGRNVVANNFVQWDLQGDIETNQVDTSDDIRDLVQAALDRDDWVSGGAINLIITALASNSNKREYFTYDGSHSKAPRLEIIFEENTVQRAAGLRFEGVRIPQGASITDARITLTSRSDSNGSSDTTVYLGDTLNSQPFTGTDSEFSQRFDSVTSEQQGVTLGSWVADQTYDLNLTELIQSRVDDPEWCGGNAMAFFIVNGGDHRAFSFEGDDAKAAALHVTFDSSTNTEGCNGGSVNSQIVNGADDVSEIGSNRRFNDTRITIADNQDVGLRFDSVDLPPQPPAGLDIINAKLRLHTTQSSISPANFSVWAQLGGGGSFSGDNDDLSSRRGDSPAASISIPAISFDGVAENDRFFEFDVSSIIGDVLGHDDWVEGNPIVFVIEGQSGSVEFTSQEFSSALGPRLLVDFVGDIGKGPTVRERIKQLVQELPHAGGTPISSTLYEAASYFRGDAVRFGLERNSGSSFDNSTRVSTPLSFEGDGAFLDRPEGCTDNNLSDDVCRNEQISFPAGQPPTYISPIQAACQSNNIVLLTDGQPSSITPSSLPTLVDNLLSNEPALANESICNNGEGGFSCANKIASFLHNYDQSPDVDGINVVNTFTIGLDLNLDGLRILAEEKGGGEYFTVAEPGGLVNAFDQIIGQILEADTTIAAPGVSVNQMNRFRHLNHLYYSIFRPTERVRWNGNLKRYRLDSGEAAVVVDGEEVTPAISPSIVDRFGDIAINTVSANVDEGEEVSEEDTSTSGQFNPSSVSFWNDAADGGDARLGGAAFHIPAPTDRNVFTFTGEYPVADSGGGATPETITALNDLREEVLGLNSDGELVNSNNLSVVLQDVTDDVEQVQASLTSAIDNADSLERAAENAKDTVQELNNRKTILASDRAIIEQQISHALQLNGVAGDLFSAGNDITTPVQSAVDQLQALVNAESDLAQALNDETYLNGVNLLNTVFDDSSALAAARSQLFQSSIAVANPVNFEDSLLQSIAQTESLHLDLSQFNLDEAFLPDLSGGLPFIDSVFDLDPSEIPGQIVSDAETAELELAKINNLAEATESQQDAPSSAEISLLLSNLSSLNSSAQNGAVDAINAEKFSADNIDFLVDATAANAAAEETLSIIAENKANAATAISNVLGGNDDFRDDALSSLAGRFNSTQLYINGAGFSESLFDSQEVSAGDVGYASAEIEFKLAFIGQQIQAAESVSSGALADFIANQGLSINTRAVRISNVAELLEQALAEGNDADELALSSLIDEGLQSLATDAISYFELNRIANNATESFVDEKLKDFSEDLPAQTTAQIEQQFLNDQQGVSDTVNAYVNSACLNVLVGACFNELITIDLKMSVAEKSRGDYLRRLEQDGFRDGYTNIKIIANANTDNAAFLSAAEGTIDALQEKNQADKLVAQAQAHQAFQLNQFAQQLTLAAAVDPVGVVNAVQQIGAGTIVTIDDFNNAVAATLADPSNENNVSLADLRSALDASVQVAADFQSGDDVSVASIKSEAADNVLNSIPANNFVENPSIASLDNVLTPSNLGSSRDEAQQALTQVFADVNAFASEGGDYFVLQAESKVLDNVTNVASFEQAYFTSISQTLQVEGTIADAFSFVADYEQRLNVASIPDPLVANAVTKEDVFNAQFSQGVQLAKDALLQQAGEEGSTPSPEAIKLRAGEISDAQVSASSTLQIAQQAVTDLKVALQGKVDQLAGAAFLTVVERTVLTEGIKVAGNNLVEAYAAQAQPLGQLMVHNVALHEAQIDVAVVSANPVAEASIEAQKVASSDLTRSLFQQAQEQKRLAFDDLKQLVYGNTEVDPVQAQTEFNQASALQQSLATNPSDNILANLSDAELQSVAGLSSSVVAAFIGLREALLVGDSSQSDLGFTALDNAIQASLSDLVNERKEREVELSASNLEFGEDSPESLIAQANLSTALSALETAVASQTDVLATQLVVSAGLDFANGELAIADRRLSQLQVVDGAAGLSEDILSTLEPASAEPGLYQNIYLANAQLDLAKADVEVILTQLVGRERDEQLQDARADLFADLLQEDVDNTEEIRQNAEAAVAANAQNLLSAKVELDDAIEGFEEYESGGISQSYAVLGDLSYVPSGKDSSAISALVTSFSDAQSGLAQARLDARQSSFLSVQLNQFEDAEDDFLLLEGTLSSNADYQLVKSNIISAQEALAVELSSLRPDVNEIDVIRQSIVALENEQTLLFNQLTGAAGATTLAELNSTKANLEAAINNQQSVRDQSLVLRNAEHDLIAGREGFVTALTRILDAETQLQLQQSIEQSLVTATVVSDQALSRQEVLLGELSRAQSVATEAQDLLDAATEVVVAGVKAALLIDSATGFSSTLVSDLQSELGSEISANAELAALDLLEGEDRAAAQEQLESTLFGQLALAQSALAALEGEELRVAEENLQGKEDAKNEHLDKLNAELFGGEISDLQTELRRLHNLLVIANNTGASQLAKDQIQLDINSIEADIVVAIAEVNASGKATNYNNAKEAFDTALRELNELLSNPSAEIIAARNALLAVQYQINLQQSLILALVPLPDLDGLSLVEQNQLALAVFNEDLTTALAVLEQGPTGSALAAQNLDNAILLELDSINSAIDQQLNGEGGAQENVDTAEAKENGQPDFGTEAVFALSVLQPSFDEISANYDVRYSDLIGQELAVTLVVDAGGVVLNQPVHDLQASNTRVFTKAGLDEDYIGRNVINWARGYDVPSTAENSNVSDFGIRQDMGAPLHSTPLLINYGNNQSGVPLEVVYVSTNDGFLHAFDTNIDKKPRTPLFNSANSQEDFERANGYEDDAKEIFSFIPQELLPNLGRLKANPTGKQIYGLDAPWTYFRRDGNADLRISGEGEFDNPPIQSLIDAQAVPDAVYLYGGMRRGGNYYYALNVTNPNNPKLKFVIGKKNNGEGLGVREEDDPAFETDNAAFANLAQTWSRPVIAKLRWPVADGYEDKIVMIFGGGYDESHDLNQASFDRTSNDKGNSVYMVDASSGELLWWAGATGSGASIEVADMKYAIPAQIRVVDLDGDRLVDFLYVADMGGQVFRFGIQPNSTDAAGLFDVQTVAKLGRSVSGALLAENRRFFESPSITIVNDPDRKELLDDIAESDAFENVLTSAIEFRDAKEQVEGADDTSTQAYEDFQEAKRLVTVAREALENTEYGLVAEDDERRGVEARYVAITLGSGYRAHPLDGTTQEMFFMLEDSEALLLKTSANPDSVETSDDATLVLGSLDDVTEKFRDFTLLRNGWYLRLLNIVATTEEKSDDPTQLVVTDVTAGNYVGEKILSGAIVINDRVLFTSYVPSASASSCTPVAGGSRFYAVNIFNGLPLYNINTIEDPGTGLARYEDNFASGLVANPQTVFGDNGRISLLTGPKVVPAEFLNLDVSVGDVRKTRWRQRTATETKDDLVLYAPDADVD